MDELFHYRLDALNYKERFIRFMADNGVLKFGEFPLQSGRISPYYIDTSNYKSASQITKLGRFYAECMIENNICCDILYGSTNRTVPLLMATSMVLFERYGKDVEYNIGNEIGTKIQPNKRITIIEDTLTSGKTLCNTIKKLRNIVHNSEINVIVSVDRTEKGDHLSKTARSYIEDEFNVKLYSVVMLQDIVGAMKSGVVSSADYLAHMTQYQEKYGGM